MTWAALTGRRSVVVSTLGVTQTLAWGSTYYLPAVFADPISAALQLPRVWFFGIFSAALLLSGLLGPLAGRIIDRYGGRDVLAATNLVFAGGLVALAFASGWAGLSLAWAILGIGMGFGLYEAAFATVAGLYGRDARNAITGITLFAGFASTVGWPPSAIFIDTFGWRGACLAWAALHLLIGLPLNWLLVPRTPPHVPDDGARASGGVRPAMDDDRTCQRVRRHLVCLDRHGGAPAAAAPGNGRDPGHCGGRRLAGRPGAGRRPPG